MPGPQRLPQYGFRGRQGVVSRRLQHPFSQPIGPRRRLRIHGEHCGLQQDQGPHPVGKAACELQGYLAAGAPADDHRRCRRQRVKNARCVFDMVAQVHAVERFRTLAAEEAPAVVDDAPAEVGQLPRRVHPQERGTRGPVNAEDGRRFAVHLVIEIDPVHLQVRHGSQTYEFLGRLGFVRAPTA